jgi:hypothetical protein
MFVLLSAVLRYRYNYNTVLVSLLQEKRGLYLSFLILTGVHRLGCGNCCIGDKAADAPPLSVRRAIYDPSLLIGKIDEDFP